MNLSDKVQYTVLRSSRRKSVSLQILPDGSVRIRVPSWLRDREISAIIEKKHSWITRKLSELSKQPLPSRDLQYRDGDILYLLGEPYRMLVGDWEKLARTWDLPRRLGRGLQVLPDRGLVVYPLSAKKRDSVPSHTEIERSAAIRRAVHAYIRTELHSLLEERLRHWTPIIFPELEGTPPFTLRSMSRRWGSCHKDGSLRFALRLYCASCECIDYIVVHEICHLVVFDHSKKFYQHVERVLPQWKDLQGELSTKNRLWQLP